MPSAPFNTLSRERYAVNPSTKSSPYPSLAQLGAPHLDSFNSIFDFPSISLSKSLPSFNSSSPDPLSGGLLGMVTSNLDPVILFDGSTKDFSTSSVSSSKNSSLGNKLEVWIDGIQVGKPGISDLAKDTKERLLFPTECRERQLTYQSKISVRVCTRYNGGEVIKEVRQFGSMPIMVRVRIRKGLFPSFLLFPT